MELTEKMLKKWLRGNFEGQPDCKWEGLSKESKRRPYLKEVVDWLERDERNVTREEIAQELYDDVKDDIGNCGAPVLSRYKDIYECWPFISKEDQNDILEYYTSVFFWDLESVKD